MRVAGVRTGARVGTEAGVCTVSHATVAGSWASVVHGGWPRHAMRAVQLVTVASRSSRRRRLGARGGGTHGSMGRTSTSSG
jgi:hypothetical protein